MIVEVAARVGLAVAFAHRGSRRQVGAGGRIPQVEGDPLVLAFGHQFSVRGDFQFVDVGAQTQRRQFQPVVHIDDAGLRVTPVGDVEAAGDGIQIGITGREADGQAAQDRGAGGIDFQQEGKTLAGQRSVDAINHRAVRMGDQLGHVERHDG